MKYDYDTIGGGAGPAGSTTAALLADKGHDVVLLEKDKFIIIPMLWGKQKKYVYIYIHIYISIHILFLI